MARPYLSSLRVFYAHMYVQCSALTAFLVVGSGLPRADFDLPINRSIETALLLSSPPPAGKQLRPSVRRSGASAAMKQAGLNDGG